MIVSLVAVMAVASMSAVFLQLSHSITKRQTHSADLKRAMYLAEAGLAEAYVGIGMAKTGNVGTPAQPAAFGEGLFWVEAVDKGGDLIELQSTAMAGAARIKLGMVVERAEISVASLGIYATQDLTVESGSLIDSYDSGQGTYAEQLASGDNNTSGIVGSSGVVTLNGSRGAVTINGDAVPGMAESVAQSGTVAISGSTSPRAGAVALPVPEAPAPRMNAAVAHISAVPLVVPTGTRGIASLSVGTGATVVIVGPATVVTGDLTLASGASVEFDVTDGPIDVFVTGDLTLPDGATLVNSAADPTQLSIQLAPDALGASGNALLGSSVEFHGSLYAPSSAVTLNAGAEVFGTLVADALTLAQGSQLHYDLAIAQGEDSLPRLANWRVVEVPGPLAAKSSDPFKALGVDPSTCRSPAEAHEDQWLEIDYLDDAGSPSSFTGWEKDFDWTDVKEVESGTRDGEAVKEATAEEREKDAPPMAAPDGTPSDWIADDTVGGDELTHYLVDASPLGIIELDGAIYRTPQLSSEQLFTIFQPNMPTAALPLGNLIENGNLDDAHLYELSQLQGAMADTNLMKVINGPKFSSAVVRQVLVDNSPLEARVLNAMRSRAIPLDPVDRDMVEAAQ